MVIRASILYALLLTINLFVFAADRATLLSVPDIKTLPLDIQVLSEKTTDGVTLTELTFAGAPFNGAPTKIYGWYARPSAAGKYPGVVQLHGAGLQELKPDAAIMYAKEGFACLSIDWCGPAKSRKEPRKPPYSEFEDKGGLAAPITEGSNTWKSTPPEASSITNGVRFVLRSFMFLRSRTEVDTTKLCLSGMSAGAHLSLLVLGQDSGIKAATVKYGEAFIRDLPGYFGGYFGPITLCPKTEQDAWLEVLDPKYGFPNYKAQILLLSGTDDIFFWMPVVLKTYRDIPTTKRLLMLPNDNHTQVGNEVIPLRYFRAVLGMAPVFPEVTTPTATLHDGQIRLSCKANGPSKLKSVTFIWKHAPQQGFNWKSNWQLTQATLTDGNWIADLTAPAAGEQFSAEATVEDETSAKVSSDTVELPEFPQWRGLPAAQQTKAPTPAAQQTAATTLADGNYMLDSSFEGGKAMSGRQGGLYLNYVGSPTWDNSGDKAHTGKVAVGITGGDKNYLAIGAPAEVGKSMRLRVYMRGERDGVKGRIQINWNKVGGGLVKYELKTPTLLTDYAPYEIVATVPPDTMSALLIISGGSGPDETIWMDDLFYGVAQ